LISGNAAAIVVGLLILIIWEVGARVFGLPSYIAPSPLQVVEAFRENWYLLLTNIGPTMFEALLGFFVGNAVAIVFAICFIHSRFAERAFYPLLVFFHTVPVLAIAPILVLIFGNGIVPKILIASLMQAQSVRICGLGSQPGCCGNRLLKKKSGAWDWSDRHVESFGVRVTKFGDEFSRLGFSDGNITRGFDEFGELFIRDFGSVHIEPVHLYPVNGS